MGTRTSNSGKVALQTATPLEQRSQGSWLCPALGVILHGLGKRNQKTLMRQVVEWRLARASSCSPPGSVLQSHPPA